MSNYNVVFRSIDTGEVLDIATAQDFIKLTYERVLNDVGEMVMTFNGDKRFAQYLNELDTIVSIYRDNGNGLEEDATFLLRYFNPELDGVNDIFVWQGYSLEHLLKRALVIPADDPVAADGYVTRAGDASIVMTRLVNYQRVTPQTNSSRALPDFGIAPFLTGFADAYIRVNEEDNLLKTLQDITDDVDIDFRVYRDTGRAFLFWAGTLGEDKTKNTNFPTSASVVFDIDLGNMIDPQLTIDRKTEITYGYLGGQGEGADRVFTEIASGRENDSPFNRIEKVYDVRLEQTLDQILAEGRARLIQDRPARELNFTISPSNQNTRYKRDIDLGDTVTGVFRNVELDYRINKVTIELEGVEETIDIELEVQQ